MKVACPHCTQHIKLDKSWFGKLLNCPNCRGIIDVPSKSVHETVGAQPMRRSMGPRSGRAYYITLAGVLLVFALLPLVWNWSSSSAENDDSLGMKNYLEQLKSERQLTGKQTPELPKKAALPEVERASTESANALPLESLQSGKPSIAGSAASKDATDESGANPVQMLLASPELWPSEVTLAHDTEFPAVLNGKVVGKVKVNAGAKVGLTAVESDSVEVEFRGGKIKLPHKETNLSQLAASLDADANEASGNSSPSEFEVATGSQTGRAAPALASVVGTYQTTNGDTTLTLNADGTAHYRSRVSVIHYKDAQHARKGLLPKDGARTAVGRGAWKSNDNKLTFKGDAVVTLSVEGRPSQKNTAPLTASFLRELNGDLVDPKGETSTRLIRQVPAPLSGKAFFDASKPIKVGFNLAMTGGDAPLDASSLKAAKLFFDEINDKGGLRVAGQPVKLEMTVRDNMSDRGQAAVVTRMLVSEDEVIAIVGPNSSFLAVPAANVAESQKCILIAPWSTRQDTTHDPAAAEPKEYVFRGCFLDEHQIEALADFAFKDLKLRKAAILAPRGHQRSEDSQSWLFKKIFEKNGGEIVAFEFLDANEDDSPAYSRIRSLKPEAIFSVDLSKGLLEKMKTWGINAQLLGADVWTRSQHLLSETTDQLIVGHYSTHFSADDTDPSASRFKSNYRRIYGEDPDEIAALTYDACTLLAEALKRVNTVDRDKVRDEFARLKNFRGVTGTFSYSDPPHDPNKSVFIVRVDKDSTRLVKETRPKTRARTNPYRAQIAEPGKSSGQPNMKKSVESSSPSGATTATVSEKARNELRTQAPSASLIRAALSDFSYSGSSCSHAESQAMLRWIGASDYSKNDASVTGKLPNSWDVTIWNDSYGKIGVYGLRYGQSRSSYAGDNSTYFEITRQ